MLTTTYPKPHNRKATMRIALLMLAAACCTIGENAFSLEPVSVVPQTAVAGPRQPQAAVDTAGGVYVTYGAGEAIYCSTSPNGEQKFGKPIRIANVTKLALGRRRGPRIAAGPDFVVVTAIGHHDGNLLAWRSTDRGNKWGGPVRVNDSDGDAREGLHAMAASPGGQLYCVWLDCRDQGRGSRIFGSASIDGGKTWSANREVYRSPSGTVCECCHPSAAFDRQGNLHVMWRNSLDGNRDLYLASSHDCGNTFGPAAKLGKGAWLLDGCPMDGGGLAAASPDEVTTIWRRDMHIYRAVAGTTNVEHRLGTGEQPWAAANNEGVWLVWLSRRGGDLYLASPHKDQPTKIADHASDPMIAASIDGRGSPIAVWEKSDGKQTAIMAALIDND